jgi:glycosyltransferase involved in cell wall biosynthesis
MTIRGGSTLHIAQVATPWFPLPPPAYGGIEAMAAGLVDALVERGHRVTVIGVGPDGTKGEFMPTSGAPEGERVGAANPEVLHAARAGHLLAAMDADVIHDHSTAGPLQARQRRAPTVVTAHGPVTGEFGDYYAALASSVHLVAISRAQQRQAPHLPWAGLVHNAVRVQDFPAPGHKEDFALFLGRFNPDKGAHLAIDAARAAGVRIVLAGLAQTSADRSYFAAEIEPRLGPDAVCVGEADRAMKVDLLSRARCLLFPVQWDEPFGMVLIEAMACGTPVVALDRGAIPEIVDHGTTGFVCRDVAELADAVRHVDRIDPRDVRDRVRGLFDVSTMATGYEAVYRQAVASSLLVAPGPRRAGLSGIGVG